MIDRRVAMVVGNIGCWNVKRSAMLAQEENARLQQVNNEEHGGENMPRQRSPLR